MRRPRLSLKKLGLLLVVFMMATSISLAHSGRTDSSGGHKDNNNVSGLGYYHYHHGMGPHLHPNGICPYDTSTVQPKIAPKEPVVIPAPPIVVVPVTPVVSSEIQVAVNGQKVSMSDAPPFVENGRTYVPIRAVLDAYGVDSITWNDPNVIVVKGSTTLKIPVSKYYIEKNDLRVSIDAPATIRNGRTCLPIRAVIEALGGTVAWDEQNRKVLITKQVDTFTTRGANGKLTVSFIDVGQGDSILLKVDDIDVLIDAGDKSSGDEVTEYLRQQGVDDLELVVASHSHADHLGGLPEVFDAFKVERYIDSGVSATTQIYNTVKSSVVSEGCLSSDDKDETIKYGDLTVQIIETVDASEDINDTSVVVLVTYGKEKMLFAGDASSAIDPWLTKIGHVNLFKVEHHGSRTGNSSALLSVLKPEISVISYEVGNSYGHPHAEAMEVINKYSGQVLWTAGHSQVISTDGITMSVQ